MKKSNSSIWKKYTFDFLSIFIAVVSAFSLNNWNENRRDRSAEANVLREISNGLIKDIDDIKLNMSGHKTGIKAIHFWRKALNNQELAQDSTGKYYLGLTRDFISIQNTSGYESLKSNGLGIIKNDSLRYNIISLYEYDFETLRKLEEEVEEMQFQKSYFKEINTILANNFEFDSAGNVQQILLPLKLTEVQKKEFLLYLWRIETNRNFILKYYYSIETKVENLNTQIERQLSNL